MSLSRDRKEVVVWICCIPIYVISCSPIYFAAATEILLLLRVNGPKYRTDYNTRSAATPFTIQIACLTGQNSTVMPKASTAFQVWAIPWLGSLFYIHTLLLSFGTVSSICTWTLLTWLWCPTFEIFSWRHSKRNITTNILEALLFSFCIKIKNG